MDIYNRQKELLLKIPESVAVLGVGGIGSWVGLFFALVGVKKLVLVDNDIVEDTNLNRTPFRLDQVGMPKVQALAELIYERREDIEVYPLIKLETEEFTKEFLRDVDIIIDCRDGEKFFEEEELQKKVAAKLGYDGVGMTVVFNPRLPSWGEEPVRYTITPSYLIPPVFLAAMVVDAVVRGWAPKDEKVITWIDGLKEVIGYE